MNFTVDISIGITVRGLEVEPAEQNTVVEKTKKQVYSVLWPTTFAIFGR